jgi:hypothetical protein
VGSELWTVPLEAYAVSTFYVLGGGGGGASLSSCFVCSGSGGGGAVVFSGHLPVPPGTVINITIGGGGGGGGSSGALGAMSSIQFNTSAGSVTLVAGGGTGAEASNFCPGTGQFSTPGGIAFANLAPAARSWGTILQWPGGSGQVCCAGGIGGAGNGSGLFGSAGGGGGGLGSSGSGGLGGAGFGVWAGSGGAGGAESIIAACNRQGCPGTLFGGGGGGAYGDRGGDGAQGVAVVQYWICSAGYYINGVTFYVLFQLV